MVQDTGPLPEGESTDEGSAGDRQTTEPVEEKTTPRTKRVLNRPRVPTWALIVLPIVLVGAIVWGIATSIPLKKPSPTPTSTLAPTSTSEPTATPAPIATLKPMPAVQATATQDTTAPTIVVANLGEEECRGRTLAQQIYEALLARLEQEPSSTEGLPRVERLDQVVEESSIRSAGQNRGATYVLWGGCVEQTAQPSLLWTAPRSRYRTNVQGQKIVLGEPESIVLCPLDAHVSHLVSLILGIDAYNRGEYEQGQAYLTEVLDAEPTSEGCPTDHGIAYLYLGNVQALEADYDTALTSYARALESIPNAMWLVHTNRGSVYYVSGQYTAALTELNQALESNPASATAYYLRGNTHRAMEQYDAALADYNRALEIAPDDPQIYASRGFIYHSQDKYELAMADYDHAVELDPSSAEVYLNRGGAYASMGDYEAAIGDYTRSLELDPREADAYYNRGTVYAIVEDYDQALIDFDRALTLEPEFAQVYGNRGIVYKTLGEKEKAIADFERFLELSDNPQWKQMIEQQLSELRDNE